VIAFSFNFLDNLIQILSTLFLGSLAIFRDWYTAVFAGPKLAVSIRDPEGESIPIFVNGAQYPGFYYHLTISNKRKWAPASNVRVLIEQEWFVDVAGQALNSRIAGPVQLDWRLPLTRPISVTVRAEDICDLAYIAQGRPLVIAVPQQQRPVNFHGAVSAGECEIFQVRAVADNGNSAAIWIRIQWDGQWSVSRRTMKDHLIITAVQNPDLSNGRVTPPPNRL